MYDSTSTEGHTCIAQKCTCMTILILSNICVYAYIYMYDSTSTEGHTCIAHTCTCMTILINMCTCICTYICMTVLVLRVVHI